MKEAHGEKSVPTGTRGARVVLGEAIALSTLLAGALKFDGVFSRV